ncbi:hypothetical protein GF385_02980 [Candidatus Dependentiae bacterium]|nr:hypothetical protein [Candidatus Dependentiae bacterium]
MKKIFLISFFILLFSGCCSKCDAFTLTVQADPSLNLPVLTRVEIDGIPRTIGTNNFQDISKKPFETTLLEKSDVEITAKIGTLDITKKFVVESAKILNIKKDNGNLKIE